MEKSTLLAIFRLLEPHEIVLLGQLIDTPLFKLPNRHNDMVGLFRYLQPFAPAFNSPELDNRDAVAQQLFGHRTRPEAELRKAMNLLLGVLKKFVLMQQVFQLNPTPEGAFLHELQSDLGLLRWLAARAGDPGQVTAKLNQTGKRPNKSRLLLEQQYRSLGAATANLIDGPGVHFNQRSYSEWLLTGFWKEYEMFEYFSDLRLATEQEKHLLRALAALDHFYCQIKLSLVVYLQANKMVRPNRDATAAAMVESQIVATRMMVQQLPPQLIEAKSVQLYIAASEMLFDPSFGELAFQRMSELMQKPDVQLPKALLRTLRTLQRAYCAHMFHSTRLPIYAQRRFDLAKIDLEEDLSVQDGTITASQFTATISNALMLGETNHTWVLSFLDKFPNGKGILATEMPREVFKTNRAYLLLQQGQYREASNELVGYEWYGRIDSPQVLLLAIRVDLKAQYELNRFDDDYTLRTLEAAEKRIVRLTGIDDQLKNMTLSFLRMLRQIGHERTLQTHLYDPRDASAKVAAWREEINSQPIAEKDWLLGKINAFRT